MCEKKPASPPRDVLVMTQYRFRTPHRTGKWYDSLSTAQRFANAIGAGFLDPTGTFVPDRGTVLELREAPNNAAPASSAAGCFA